MKNKTKSAGLWPIVAAAIACLLVFFVVAAHSETVDVSVTATVAAKADAGTRGRGDAETTAGGSDKRSDKKADDAELQPPADSPCANGHCPAPAPAVWRIRRR